MSAFVSLLAEHRIFILVAHILSMAVGLGGATVSDILFFRFLKDFRISKKEVEVLHILKAIILFAMFVIVFSGLFLYLPDAETYKASAMFRVKTIVVFVLVMNGVALHLFIAPYLIRLNFASPGSLSRAWSRLAFALGSISITSWYGAFLIAMLKRHLPFGFSAMLGLYAGALAVAITVSQITEAVVRSKATMVKKA